MGEHDDDVQERITGFWDLVAPGYDDPSNVAAAFSEGYRAWTQALRAVLPPPPARVLDVGTGTGFAAGIAAELGHVVAGIDTSAGMLSVARSKQHEVIYVRGDAIRPPFRSGHFDVVMSRSLIWTLRDLDIAFRNWFELLVPGGRAMAIYGLTAPADAPETAATGEDADGSTDIFTRHYTPTTRAALEAMQLNTHDRLLHAARAAGFVDVRVTALEMVRGWETSPGSDLPYALVAHHP